jgi:hypothetical protein
MRILFIALLGACIRLDAEQALLLMRGVNSSITTGLGTSANLTTLPLRYEIVVKSMTPNGGPVSANLSLFVSTSIGLTVTTTGMLRANFTDAAAGATLETSIASRTGGFWARAQRDIVNRKARLEIQNLDGTDYVLEERQIMSPAITGNLNTLTMGSSSTATYGDFEIDKAGWCTTVVNAGAPPPTASNAAPCASYASYEFHGNSLDSSGNNRNFSFSPAPAYSFFSYSYPPYCDAGVEQSTRAGQAFTLNGANSYGIGSAITYTWRQEEVPDDPPAVITNRQAQSPTVIAPKAGSYRFRLTVTDQQARSATCVVEHGAVAQDAKGLVVFPNNAFRLHLAPLSSIGAGPFSYINAEHLHWADIFTSMLDLPDIYPGIWGGDVGTVELTNSSTAVKRLTGPQNLAAEVFCTAGTATPTRHLRIPALVNSDLELASCTTSAVTLSIPFTGVTGTYTYQVWSPLEAEWNVALGSVQFTRGATQMVRLSGPSFDGTLCSGTSVLTPPVLHHNTGTGSRKFIQITSCPDGDHADVAAAYRTALPDGTYTYARYSNAKSGNWVNGNANAVYYQAGVALYSAYYRTGYRRYLRAARELMDRQYQQPFFDQGECGHCSLPRLRDYTGMFLRMHDGRPEMQAGLDRGIDITSGPRYEQTVGVIAGNPKGLYFPEVREASYQLDAMADSLLLNSNPVRRIEGGLLADLKGVLANRWFPQQWRNGAWYSMGASCTNLNGTGCTAQAYGATVTQGSKIVTAPAAGWTQSSFDGCMSDGATVVVASNLATLTTVYPIIQEVGEVIRIRGSNTAALNGASYTILSKPDARTITFTTSGVANGTYSNAGMQFGGGWCWFSFHDNIFSGGQNRLVAQSQDASRPVYPARFVSPSEIELKYPYEGVTSSTKWWSRSGSADASNVGGWFIVPWFQGLTASALIKAYDAVLPHDPEFAATIIPRIVANLNYAIADAPDGGINPNRLAPYYHTLGGGCAFPIDEGGPKCVQSSVSGDRDLWAEIIGPLAVAHSRGWANYSAPLERALGLAFATSASEAYYDGNYYRLNSAFSGASKLKWLGLHFGKGAVQKGQAALLGQVAEVDMRTVRVTLGQPSTAHPSCTAWRVTRLSPDGSVAQYSSTTSSVTITTDARLGAASYTQECLGSDGRILRASSLLNPFPM